MKDIAIRVENLKKVYKLYNAPIDRVKEAFSITKRKYGSEKYVLKDISFDVKRGEVVGIVGTNGAGKSTLLKIVTGVVTPTAGQIQMNGKVAALLELGTGFNPEFTGIKNIFLNGTMMGFTHEEMEKKLQSIIDFADIGDFINQPVKIYSSGMFARLAFSVAINVDPDILIVDEALSVGDMRFQMKCMKKMKDMMDNGVTVLFVSHDINAIRRLCTKCVWLKDGQVQLYDETNKVCDQYADYLKVNDQDNNTVIQETVIEEKKTEDDGIKKFVEGNRERVGEIAGIRLLNAQGDEIDEINLFEKFQVEIVYDVYDESIEPPVLGVALKRVDEEYICGLNTMLDKIKIPWEKGRNRYKLIYNEGIRVLGGKYYFDVALFDMTATVPIHYWAKIKEFTVNADYIGEGICILPHIWRK